MPYLLHNHGRFWRTQNTTERGFLLKLSFFAHVQLPGRRRFVLPSCCTRESRPNTRYSREKGQLNWREGRTECFAPIHEVRRSDNILGAKKQAICSSWQGCATSAVRPTQRRENASHLPISSASSAVLQNLNHRCANVESSSNLQFATRTPHHMTRLISTWFQILVPFSRTSRLRSISPAPV
jgi:hypothetical protein